MSEGTTTLRFEDPAVAKFYKDVPAAQVESLLKFQADHPHTTANINGMTWEYIDAGRGDIPLLLLTGALGTPESSRITIRHFTEQAETYRVIAPAYPMEIATMGELADGIAAILAREGLGTVNVVGGSYGGMVAQAFEQRHPEKTKKLLLSHTPPPNPEHGEQLMGMLRWYRWVPLWLMRRFLKRSLGGLVSEENADVAWLMAHMREVIDYRLTKAGFLNMLRRTGDFMISYANPRGTATDYAGKVLLLLSDNDPSTPDATRAALQARYPGAALHLFEGTGHMTALLQQDAYYAAIEGFIQTSDF